MCLLFSSGIKVSSHFTDWAIHKCIIWMRALTNTEAQTDSMCVLWHHWWERWELWDTISFICDLSTCALIQIISIFLFISYLFERIEKFPTHRQTEVGCKFSSEIKCAPRAWYVKQIGAVCSCYEKWYLHFITKREEKKSPKESNR